MPWDGADLEFESSAATRAILVTSALPAAHTDETPTGEYLTSPPSLLKDLFIIVLLFLKLWNGITEYGLVNSSIII